MRPYNRPMQFQSIPTGDLPAGHSSKHREVVERVLRELSLLADDRALTVPLSDVSATVKDLRAAVSRGALGRGIAIQTASVGVFLRVEEVKPPRQRCPALASFCP